jgi:ABC-type nitrate/sulfonate/bicarbonate transport system substrate-binding protein
VRLRQGANLQLARVAITIVTVRQLVRLSICGVLLATIGGMPSVVAAQNTRVLRMSTFVPDSSTVLARASGALAASGLDVDVTITPSSTAQMQGLSDGTYDIASTAFDNVLAWSGRAGADIVAVSQTDAAVELPILVRPEISDWSDLRGHVLAVDAADTAFALVLRRVLRAHGLELDRDYTFAAVGATAFRLQAMQDGTAYGAILNPPVDAQALAAGMVRLGDQSEVLPEYPGGVLAVRRDWAEANTNDLIAFLRAWSAAGELAEAEPDAAAATLGKVIGVSPDQARRRLPIAFNGGALNIAGLAAVLGLRNEFGYELPMGPDLSVYYDTRYYQAASVSK